MHHVAWVVPPLVLAGVLTFSAVSKLGKGESLRSIVRNLRLSDRILPVPLARAIPGIELALAAGLLLPWAPAFGLAAAGCLGLMLVYWTLIARGLTIHPRPSCGCFGQAGEHQISGRTLLRNTLLVLAAAGAVALALSGRTVWSLLGGAAAGDWWWLALGALACAATGLVLAGSAAEGTMVSPTPASTGHSAAHEGGHEHEHAHDHGHPHVDDAADPDGYVRTPIPRVVLHDPASGPVTLHELSAQRAQLLVLVDCYCESTRVAMGQVESWDARFELVDVRLVFSIPLIDSLGTPPAGTLVDHAGLAWEALGLTASPSAVLLGIDGHLAGGPASGYDEVLDFLDEVQEVLAEALPPQDRLMDEGRLSDEGQLTAER